MPKEIIEIVDTAVKIGLGSVIAGIVSYITIKSTHNNDKQKFLLQHKINTIEKATDEIEVFLNAWSDLLSKCGGISRDILKEEKQLHELTNEQSNIINKVDKALVRAINNKNYASSRFGMLGANKVVESIESTLAPLKAIREVVEFEHRVPSKEEFEVFKNEYYSLRSAIRNEIQNFFQMLGT